MLETRLMIQEYLSQITDSLMAQDTSEVVSAMNILKQTWELDSSVWIVGNGGSAATASHFANDLVKMCGIKAFSVADMTPTMMAYGNDNGWENMFSGALDVFMGPQDVLVAISCGGKSVNVLRAMEMFGPKHRIVLTGNDANSPLAQMEAGAKIFVEADDIRIQEDVHLVVCHMLAGMLSEVRRER